MRTKNNSSSKCIEIVLSEEKFYFPGEILRGNVIVHPKNPTKTNYITVRFTGEVQLSLENKQSFLLFQKSQCLRRSADEKVFVLEPRPNTFPFEFKVPNDKALPSTMEYGKKAIVRYTLTAIHDRPMVPEAFSAKTEFVVPILEYLDIEETQFRAGQGKAASVQTGPGKVCRLRVTTPHIGYARGSIVHVGATLNSAEPVNATKGLTITLVRLVDFRSGRHRFTDENKLKTVVHDIRMLGSSQAISSQLMIPTSTPPTICYQQTTVRIFYQIRVCAHLDGDRKIKVDLPVVVGTWPRADIPIDDDEEGSAFMSDSQSEGRQSIASESFRYSFSSINSNHRLSYASSHQHLPLNPPQPQSQPAPPPPLLYPFRPPSTYLADANAVDRSNSNTSKSSQRSRNSAASSYRSWDSQSASGNTFFSMPETPLSPHGSDHGNAFYRRPSRIVCDPKHVPMLQPILASPSADLSDNSSSEDDSDLFRILEKKKRAVAKQLRERIAQKSI